MCIWQHTPMRKKKVTNSATFQRDFGEVTAPLLFLKFKLNVNSNENKSKNATGEDTYAGALRAPRAGSPAGVFAFVFV